MIASAENISPAKPIAQAARQSALWPEMLLSLAATSIVIGIIWDISWHISIGRDTFWTMAHMAIYLGGTLGGCVGGWLAIKHTFYATVEEHAASVQILGARAPLGAWVATWGAIAMITSAPFDDWWHNAYGLDVKIISPPHALLGLGMFGISAGALLLTLSRQNREPQGPGGGLFVYMGGVFLTLGMVFLTEFTYANQEHTGIFYIVCAMTLGFRLVAMGRAGRMSFAATRVSLVYIGIYCLMIWILPLFPAQPKLAPIYNHVTHMVPPAFPLLLFVPALGVDLYLRSLGENNRGFRRVGSAFVLGLILMVGLLVAQWYFAEFLLSPSANNWFFAGDRYWGYGSGTGSWRTEFWDSSHRNSGDAVLGISSFLKSWVIAGISSWLGLLWGGWMRKVKR